MAQINRNKVVIFYSNKDVKHADRIRIHLDFLETKGLIEVWDDTDSAPGALRQEEFQHVLFSASVAILLVSADFLASTFFKDHLPILLDLHKDRGAVIFSVIISPCAFLHTELAVFQAVNDPLKPINSLKSFDQEKIWDKLVDYVRNAILSPKDENDVSALVHNQKNAVHTASRFLFYFLYRDDTMIDNLLSQLGYDPAIFLESNKFSSLYTALQHQHILRQLLHINQPVYDNIQPGQIIEVRGKAIIAQSEERADKLDVLTRLNAVIKTSTGRDFSKDVLDRDSAQEAYNGVTALMAENKLEGTRLIIKSFDAPRFKFLATLTSQHIKRKKEDLKTELTMLGMVHKRLVPGEKLNVFRLLPDMSSFGNMNRAMQRKTKKSNAQSTNMDEFVPYPAVNVYPIAIYL